MVAVCKKKDDIICVNKRAAYDYTIIKKYELGLILFGWEVKSIRCNCSVNLKNSYIIFHKHNSLYLYGAVIEPSSFVDKSFCIDLNRKIFVLLNKKEIFIFKDFLKKKGTVIVPLKLYWRSNYIKLEVGLCLGKKLYEKKKKDAVNKILDIDL